MVGAKVRELTDGFLWFVCGLYVVILMSPLNMCLCPTLMFYLKVCNLTVCRYFTSGTANVNILVCTNSCERDKMDKRTFISISVYRNNIKEKVFSYLSNFCGYLQILIIQQ